MSMRLRLALIRHRERNKQRGDASRRCLDGASDALSLMADAGSGVGRSGARLPPNRFAPPAPAGGAPFLFVYAAKAGDSQ